MRSSVTYAMPFAMASSTERVWICFAPAKHGARDLGAVLAPEDAHREFGAPRAHEAREADDLARADKEGGVIDDLAAGVDGVVGVPVLDAEDLLADVLGARREQVVQRTADHRLDESPLRVVLVLHREVVDGVAVANDRDGVRDRPDLRQLVGDDDRRDALVAQPPDEVEQVRGVVVVERRGGLIENEKFDVLRQRLGDLDELLLADA